MKLENAQRSPVDPSCDAIVVCGLEYDVASVGATEPSNSEENQAAFYLVFYRLPEQK